MSITRPEFLKEKGLVKERISIWVRDNIKSTNIWNTMVGAEKYSKSGILWYKIIQGEV